MTEQQLDEKETSSETTGNATTTTTDTGHQNEDLNPLADNNQQQTDLDQLQENLKDDILNFLCQNNEIHFKSQQIDDPEFTFDEKKEIAKEILEKNHGTFLLRFGRYLNNEHLNYFENQIQDNDRRMNLDDDDDDNENDFEVKFLLKDLRKTLEHKHKNIKNRRYAAMQAMIKENNYFSEKEMMQREPHLYEQLVGQYLTESEKRVRDSYDPKNTTFTNIILEKYDRDRIDELRKKQEDDEEQQQVLSDDAISQSSFCGSSKASEIGICSVDRKQWGNFDDNESEKDDQQDKPSTSSNIKKDKSQTKHRIKSRNQHHQQKSISASEREMLRQEFVGIMYSKFLEGEDKDFDYSKIDNNADLDDLKQIGQDDEDEYFDESDDEEGNFESRIRYRNVIRMQDEEMESEEDELDTYMRHLSKHPTLQKRNDDDEEEEEEEEDDD